MKELLQHATQLVLIPSVFKTPAKYQHVFNQINIPSKINRESGKLETWAKYVIMTDIDEEIDNNIALFLALLTRFEDLERLQLV